MRRKAATWLAIFTGIAAALMALIFAWFQLNVK